MDNRKDLKRAYKEIPKKSGILQIKNKVNSKVFISGRVNVDAFLNSNKAQLKFNSHRNKELQSEYNEFGADNFTFEILEYIKLEDDLNYDYSEEVALLEEIWLEKLQPFGEKGYNKRK